MMKIERKLLKRKMYFVFEHPILYTYFAKIVITTRSLIQYCEVRIRKEYTFTVLN